MNCTEIKIAFGTQSTSLVTGGNIMRSLAVAFLLVLSLQQARAQNIEAGADHFQWVLKSMWGSTPAAAKWLSTIPIISEDCNFRVDRGHLQILVSQFRDGGRIAFISTRIPLKDNDFYHDWQIMLKASREQACGVANKLWGEDGTMFPGVFRD